MEIRRTGHLVTLAGAAIAVCITLAIDSIKGLNLFDVFQSVLGFIAPPMTTVFLFGVLWKRTTTKAVNSILIFGTLLSMGTGICYLWIFPADTYDFWPHFLLLSFYLFLLLSVLMVLISLTDKSGSAEVSPEERKDAGMSGKVRWLWGALAVVMIVLYVLFNGH